MCCVKQIYYGSDTNSFHMLRLHLWLSICTLRWHHSIWNQCYTEIHHHHRKSDQNMYKRLTYSSITHFIKASICLVFIKSYLFMQQFACSITTDTFPHEIWHCDARSVQCNCHNNMVPHRAPSVIFIEYNKLRNTVMPYQQIEKSIETQSVSRTTSQGIPT